MSPKPRSETRFPRGRGCRQCLRRRVKCDERPQACMQCTRLGLACSGPVEGPLIVNMTHQVSQGQNKSKELRNTTQENVRPRHQDLRLDPASQNTPNESPSSEMHSSPGFDDGRLCQNQRVVSEPAHMAACANDQNYSQFWPNGLEWAQLFQDRVYEECFVAQFVYHCMRESNITSSRRRSFMEDLPLLASLGHTKSLRYSIRAAALGYYALVCHDQRAEVAALQCYQAALRSHVEGLQAVPSGQEDWLVEDSPAEILPNEHLCVSVLLSHFEIPRCTTPDAWAQHQTAAVNLLLLKGPVACRNGPDRAVFRSLRVYQAFYSLLRNVPSEFSSHDWCWIPFHETEKLSFDFLIDILLCIPSKMGLLGKTKGSTLWNSTLEIPQLDPSARATLEARANELLSQLERWWNQFRGEYSEQIPSQIQGGLPGFSLWSWGEQGLTPSSTALDFHDTYVASSIAVYSATVTILHAIILRLKMAGSEGRYEDGKLGTGVGRTDREIFLYHQSQITAHSCSVLHAAAYQLRRHRFGGDSLRTAFALKVVSLFAWEVLQQREAQKTVEEWGYYKNAPAFSGKPSIVMPF